MGLKLVMEVQRHLKIVQLRAEVIVVGPQVTDQGK
jgi:hypothetical protein